MLDRRLGIPITLSVVYVAVAARAGLAERTGHGLGVDRSGFALPRSLQVTAGSLDAPPLWRYRERHFHFDPGVLEVEDRTDLDGFFQSVRYFQHCEERIRAEFRFTPEILARTRRRLDGHWSPGSSLVAVHVRRGDYVGRADQSSSLHRRVLPPGHLRGAMVRRRSLPLPRRLRRRTLVPGQHAGSRPRRPGAN